MQSSQGWAVGVWEMAAPKWPGGGWKMPQQLLGLLGGACCTCWERMDVTFDPHPQFYLSGEGKSAYIGSTAFL